MKKLAVLAALAALVVVASAATTTLAAEPPAKKEAPAAKKEAPAAAKKEAPAAAKKEEAAPENAPPPPSPELDKNLKAMVGRWHCDVKYADSAYGKAHNAKASFQAKADLNGYFYMARYEERKAKDNPHPYVMQQVIGFDPSKSQLVRTDMDGMGSITHLTSAGFQDDKLVWEGDTMAGPQKMKFKETLTKKSAREMDIAMELAGPDGAYAPLTNVVCKK